MFADVPQPPTPKLVSAELFVAVDKMMVKVYDGPARVARTWCNVATINGRRTRNYTCEVRFTHGKHKIQVKGTVIRNKCIRPVVLEDVSGNVTVVNWCYRFANVHR